MQKHITNAITLSDFACIESAKILNCIILKNNFGVSFSFIAAKKLCFKDHVVLCYSMHCCSRSGAILWPYSSPAKSLQDDACVSTR